MDVRPLSTATVPYLLDLARCQVEETLPHMTFEHDVARHYADWVLGLTNSHIRVWLAWAGEAAVGYLIATRIPYFFCRGHSVTQEVLYVVPEYRGSRAALHLMKAMDAWADEQGALEVYAGIANGFNPTRTAAFMEKALSYETVGYQLRKIRHADD